MSKRGFMHGFVILFGGLMAGGCGLLLYDVGGWKLTTAILLLFCSYSVSRFYWDYMDIVDQTHELERMRHLRDELNKVRDEIMKDRENNHE
jgi:hypothetical protein